MPVVKHYVADTPLIKVDCLGTGSDLITISGATNTKILYSKPDGTSGEWVATILDNRYLTYQVSGVSELDIAGDWKFQAYVELGTFKGKGETEQIRIYASFR